MHWDGYPNGGNSSLFTHIPPILASIEGKWSFENNDENCEKL